MSLQRIRSFLRATLLSTLAAASMAAYAGPFSSVFFFGDSLSDTGNVSIATGGAAPDPNQPYAPGRFSNGPVWVETFAAGLGLAGQANPALARVPGYNNFAFGGARTGFSGQFEPAGVLTQVAGLWGQGMPINPNRADPNALYVVVAGGNDMRDARSIPNGDATTRKAAAEAAFKNLVTAIEYLAASGARNVLISTLPDLGATPEAAFLKLQAESTDATNQFNGLLRSLPLGYAGLSIKLLDMADIAADVRNNPDDFGVNNTDLPCGAFAGNQGASCATSLFSDALHPSAYAHSIIGHAALAIYGVPVPGTLALMALALLLLLVVQRSRWAMATLRPAAL
jgi:outer membrane lipase/esterase